MNEMLERVAKAIRDTPQVFWRVNKGVDLPNEVVRYGTGDEPEIVVMAACLRYSDVAGLAEEMRTRLCAKAAIEAMRTPTEAMRYAAYDAWDWGPGSSLDGRDVDAKRCWTTMIDVALKEEDS